MRWMNAKIYMEVTLIGMTRLGIFKRVSSEVSFLHSLHLTTFPHSLTGFHSLTPALDFIPSLTSLDLFPYSLTGFHSLTPSLDFITSLTSLDSIPSLTLLDSFPYSLTGFHSLTYFTRFHSLTYFTGFIPSLDAIPLLQSTKIFFHPYYLCYSCTTAVVSGANIVLKPHQPGSSTQLWEKCGAMLRRTTSQNVVIEIYGK